MEERNIPLKNYILLSVVLILSIVLVVYFYMWYGTYEENRLSTPIMDKYISLINYNELDDYLVENKNAIIYVSVLNDEEIRIFEKKFKNLIKDNFLNNTILYLNLTSQLDSKILDDIKFKYSIDNLPCILVFRNGNVDNIYDIGLNSFDIELLSDFLVSEGIIND